MTGADDILQFMKVLFVASEIIQKQFDEKANKAVEESDKEFVSLDLIHDAMVNVENNVEMLLNATKNQKVQNVRSNKAIVKKIINTKVK